MPWRKAAKIFLIFTVFMFAAISLVPIYWMFTTSLKETGATMRMPPEFFPSNATLASYRKLIASNYPVLRWLANSLAISFLTVAISLPISAMMGYSFAKKRYPLRNILFLIILATMMLPKQVSLIPLFISIRNMGLVNNYLGAALPLAAWPFGVFMLRQFMRTIPDSIIDAASIDGASELYIFIMIILPLSAPALACFAIFMFMAAWSDFMWQLIVLRNMNMWTTNIGISVISKVQVGGATVVDYSLSMAASCLAAIPIIILFFSFQKYFVKGIVMGALKD
jgi:multiple sugar transport system permease protein